MDFYLKNKAQFDYIIAKELEDLKKASETPAPNARTEAENPMSRLRLKLLQEEKMKKKENYYRLLKMFVAIQEIDFVA